jgi:hypothetical protein
MTDLDNRVGKRLRCLLRPIVLDATADDPARAVDARGRV